MFITMQNLNQDNLAKYFRLVAELDKKFKEFRKLKKKLTKVALKYPVIATLSISVLLPVKIQQEVSALENLEERYDEDSTEEFFNKTQLVNYLSMHALHVKYN